jgi:hypothetical protein
MEMSRQGGTVLTPLTRPPNVTPRSVHSSASATAMITNVAPSATVTKSLDSLQCAVVRYKVKVTNNKPGNDTLTLSDLTLIHLARVADRPRGSRCAVPAPRRRAFPDGAEGSGGMRA